MTFTRLIYCAFWTSNYILSPLVAHHCLYLATINTGINVTINNFIINTDWYLVNVTVNKINAVYAVFKHSNIPRSSFFQCI